MHNNILYYSLSVITAYRFQEEMHQFILFIYIFHLPVALLHSRKFLMIDRLWHLQIENKSLPTGVIVFHNFVREIGGIMKSYKNSDIDPMIFGWFPITVTSH